MPTTHRALVMCSRLRIYSWGGPLPMLPLNLHRSCAVGILQTRKLRHREVKQSAKGTQSGDLSPGQRSSH